MTQEARVCAIMYGGSGEQDDPIAANVREVSALIDQAAQDQPDLIALPECFNALGLKDKPLTSTAEPIDGPTVAAIAAKARQYNTYIVCPIYEQKEGLLYNSAVLIDRAGHPLGAYHKMCPTPGELEAGVTPGEDAWVVETDFGPVGFAICFDLNFRAVGEANRRQGAKLVVFSSMYRGGLSARIWAYDFGCYLLSSTPSEMSHLCDPLGRVIADLWHYQPVMARSINLDFEILHIDENGAKWPEIRKRFGPRVALDILGPEGVFMMTSRHPEMSIRDIIAALELEPRTDYFERASQARERALKCGGRRADAVAQTPRTSPAATKDRTPSAD